RTHPHLVEVGWRKPGGRDRTAQSCRSQLGRWNGRKGTLKRADGGSHGAQNHDFLHNRSRKRVVTAGARRPETKRHRTTATLIEPVRTLAVDFGETRVGVAISDPEGRVATPLATLVRRSDQALIEAIGGLCREYEVERLVLGEPRSPED